jgi:hypothetical protein
MRRQAYNAAIGAITIGGHLGEPMSRLIDSTGRPVTPTPPELVDVVQLEQVTGLLTGLDLRYGGGLVSQLSKALLRWAVVMLDAANMADPVPARLYAVVGALAACRRHIALAEQAHERTTVAGAAGGAGPDRQPPGWVCRLASPAQLDATTGHALAMLALRTGEAADQAEAVRRLAAAAGGFDPVGHARARALCLARLATVHLAAGELEPAAGHTRQVLAATEQIRSARLTYAIIAIRAAAARHPDTADAGRLIEEIDAGIGAPDAEPASGHENGRSER